MTARSAASTTVSPAATEKRSHLLRRIAWAVFVGCTPLAAAYGFLPLPDVALYREPDGR
jgi:hypothetical protein